MSSKKHKEGSTASLQEQLVNPPSTEETEALENQNPGPPIDEAEVQSPQNNEELRNQFHEADAKAKQYWDRILRMQAEADNVQRRVERDIEKAHKYALEKFVSELLPVIDSLERAIAAHSSEESQSGSLLDGVDLTLKMFCAAVEKFGVEQIDPTSQPFNPELHQAVSTQEDKAVSSGIVLNVLQKGYCLNKRLIRPALVVVAK